MIVVRSLDDGRRRGTLHPGTLHPGALHPGAWWLWALGLATMASRTTNPIFLGLIAAVAGLVVAARRTDSPWARAYGMYLKFGLVVISIRVGFRILVGASFGTHVLVSLPTASLPDWMAGVVIGGPVTIESVLAAGYDGLRLAVLLACLGAANALADPKRLLRSIPGALHDIGAAIVVAASLAPQIVESVQRVRRARVLRGGVRRGMRGVDRVLVPVLEDALERSIALAGAMDSRGYGRTGTVGLRDRRITSMLMLTGLSGATIGVYGLLDGTASRLAGLPILVLGMGLATLGLRRAGRRIVKSVYRRDVWHRTEWMVTLLSVFSAAMFVATGNVDVMYPAVQPPVWPSISGVGLIAIAMSAAPAWLSPPAEEVLDRAGETLDLVPT